MLKLHFLIILLLVTSCLAAGCQPLIIEPESSNSTTNSVAEDMASGEVAPESYNDLSTEFLFKMNIELSEPSDVGSGELGLRVVSIFEQGNVEGPRLTAEIVPGGEHWFLIRSDDISELYIRGAIQTVEGDTIDFLARGFCGVAHDVTDLACSGELVNPSDALYRGAPFFKTSAPGYDWLNHTVAFATYRYDLSQVEISIYALQ
ncbi:MAG: DUF3237 domain-containing protein [Caldilineaceae bacterium]